MVGGILVPLLLGVGLGDLLSGLPINEHQEFTGNFWNLLTAYGLWTGVTMLALCLLHGATFLMLRTTGDVHAAARRFARTIALAGRGDRPRFRDLDAGDLRARGAADALCRSSPSCPSSPRRGWSSLDNEGWAFAATALTIASSVGSIFVALYPNVLVSSTNPAFNLTVSNSASGAYALKVMTVVTVVLFPVVLVYQTWTFYVFRKRVIAPPPGPDQAAEPTTAVGP